MSPIYEEHRSERYEPPVIDLENKNSSLVLLIELTGRNKDVLEVGTSTGYISRILKERGNTVTGIEIDPEAGEIAGQHCDTMIIGDIEKLDLDAYLAPSSFDVIIFGDVLEHLASPEDVLRKVKKYLRPDGYLAVSLPNVCHGDVILNLLMGDFKYTSMGLLDATHLRFFGLRNIIDLFSRCGYSITGLHTTVLPVGGTELRVDPGLVPEDLANFVKSLPNSNVYQYIFEASPSPGPEAPEAVPVPDLDGLFRGAIEGSIQAETRPLLEELSAYETRTASLDEQVKRLTEETRSLQGTISERDAQVALLDGQVEQLTEKTQSLQGTVSERDAQIALLAEQVEQLTEETQSLQGTVSERDAQIASLNEQTRQQAAQLMRLSNELASIKQSIVWRLLMKYHNGFVERILPQNTKRRALYDRVLKGGRIIINDGWGNFWSTYGAYKSSKKHPSSISESVEEKILKDPESGKEANCVSSDTSAIKCKLSGFLSQPYLMLKFPKFENPVVSLVILTFNKAAITYQCLESLLAHTDVPYELILVDNGSTDETSSLLDRLENVVIVRNSENLGFVLGCNNGAKIAKGKHLLFLNNDTVVTPNWLSHLVRTIESYPKCGAVGCKLVWPNGLLQEAGSIIWRDGSALGYGRGDNPLKPEYSYLREVDYCSGACLLVRKDLFWAVGGFDELYAPAYYEDSDLCLGIQKLGYKVVYQPAVTIFHHEFTSSTPDKARELMVDNQVKFLAKRKDLLCYKESPSLDNVFIARDTRKEKTVLVLDDRIPVPGQGSGYPRANELLRFLGELGYKITFFPLDNTTPWQPHTFEFQQLGIEVFYGGNLDFNKFAQERLGYYDIVIVSRPHNLEKTYDTIKACFSNAYLIYDAEAMFSVREILKAKSQGVMLSEGRTKAMMGKEICLMKKADMVTTVSENEKQLIVKKSGLRNVMVIGHSINTQDYNSDFNARKDVLFVGGFLASNGPNDDAVLYFVKEIWPRVQKSLSCKFYIVGINPPDSVKNLASASVIVTGFVPDLREYYDKCRLFVVPHRYAAGIPWKLQEAMSYGIPSVVSELMASQLNLQDGKEVMVASNPDEFADKIIELYQNEDLWRQLQMNAIKYIETECSPLKIKNTLKTIMDKTEESR